MHWPAGGGEQDVVVLGAGLHAHDAVARIVELHGDLAGAVHVGEVGELVAPHRAARGGEHHVEALPALLVLRQRQDGGDALALLQRQKVDQRLAASLRGGERQPPDLQLVDHAARGEEQHRRMRVGHEELGDEVLLARRHAGAALAAAPLRPVLGKRHALDVAGMRERDDHVLALDQVLVLELAVALDDLRLARRGELVAHRDQLVLDDRLDAGARGEDVEIVADLGRQLLQLVGDLRRAERRQTLQAQVEDGARLLFRQLVGAVLGDQVSRIGDQLHQRLDVLRRPAPLHQALARRGRIGRGADQRDHLVDIGDGRGETDQHMRAVARLAEQELRAAAHHLFAEGDEAGEDVLQPELLRPSAVQRHDVDAEARLQRREAVELVQHHVAHRVALQLDDHAHAVAVGFVADVGDALDALVAHQLGHLLLHRRLVHLVGHFGDDDRLAVLAHRLERHLGPHDDRAAAGLVGGADAGAAEDDAAGGEIRPVDELHQLRHAEMRLVDQRDRGVDHLAEIVRRDVGRHADGDAAGAVHQDVGEGRRQDHRLLQRVVVVVAEVDGLLVEIVQQRVRRLVEPHLGVAHGRGRIAVERAEIALPVDQRHAHGEVLRHPAPARRRSPGRHADGTCPSPRRPRRPTCDRACSSPCPFRAWRRECGGAPASARRAHRAARATRSRSWRNRRRSAASRR